MFKIINIVFIVGLPGSGKTYLALNKYVPMGFVLIDDPLSLNEIRENLLWDKDLVITDPFLCSQETRIAAIKKVEALAIELGKVINVDFVYFENNLAAAKKLLEHRNDNRVINSFTAFQYKIPAGVEPLPIWNPDSQSI